MAEDHAKICQSAGLAPMQHNVQVNNIVVNDYYTRPLDPVERVLYDKFGIKFVNVRHKNIDYLIYAPQLAAVVARLSLYY